MRVIFVKFCYNDFIICIGGLLMDNQEQYEQELDLNQLIRIMLMRWYIILAAVVVVAGAATFYTFMMQDDYYTAERTFAISVEADDTSTVAGHQLAERLVNSYIDFSTSKVVLDELRDVLQDHPDITRTYTNTRLRNMITVSGRSTQSIAIDITVTSGDPDEAAIIANELFNVIDMLTRSDQIENLQTVDSWGIADVPEFPSGPNRLLYMVIGVILGGMVGVFGVFLFEFFDKTIKSTKDVESKLGIRVLGILPDYEMEEEVVE